MSYNNGGPGSNRSPPQFYNNNNQRQQQQQQQNFQERHMMQQHQQQKQFQKIQQQQRAQQQAQEQQTASSSIVRFSDFELEHFKSIFDSSSKLKFYYYFGFHAYLVIAFTLFIFDFVTLYLYFAKNDQDSISEKIPLARYVYAASVGLDLVLTSWDWYQAKFVLNTEDVSYIFTNRVALILSLLGSPARFTLYKKLVDTRTLLDRMALFVYYQLRDWKSYLFVITPRRIINILFVSLNFSRLMTLLKNPSKSDFSPSNLSILTSGFQAINYVIATISIFAGLLGFIWINFKILSVDNSDIESSNKNKPLDSDVFTPQTYGDNYMKSYGQNVSLKEMLDDPQEEEPQETSANLKAFCITLIDHRLAKLLREYGYAVSKSPNSNRLPLAIEKKQKKLITEGTFSSVSPTPSSPSSSRGGTLSPPTQTYQRNYFEYSISPNSNSINSNHGPGPQSPMGMTNRSNKLPPRFLNQRRISFRRPNKRESYIGI